MSKFRVGDVCEWVYVRNPAHCICETTVIGIYGADLPLHRNPNNAYRCLDPDGTVWAALPDQIRLKRPPNNDDTEPRADLTSGDWELCPWRPKRERA